MNFVCCLSLGIGPVVFLGTSALLSVWVTGPVGFRVCKASALGKRDIRNFLKLRAAVAATAVLTQGTSAADLFASLAVVSAIR